MNIFDYLTGEAETVVRRLNAVVEHYPATADWTWDRTFEEAKKDIDLLADHLKKETVVEGSVPVRDDVIGQMDQAKEQRKDINSSIDNVLMIHVDEAGFKEGIKKLADKLEDHTNFCSKSYYPLLEKQLSQEQMQKIQDQLEFSLPG